ncbi:PaaI family thioesterase [Roseomonas populi]|uniref:PaaI family thioesterase n=1 Tax=Roseomonas populi TaxID=3121582 RepID=A0ABT1X0N0_9PROT|nr:PaaI family thioesterase [Roseomonas pecuniae]MCR0981655.1 PaaI family thioesterase [Roseomonas pecuniae]
MTFNPEAAGWSRRPPVGFSGHTGPYWSRPEGDGWAYGLVVEPHHLNGHGITHGGLLMTMLDNTLGLTAWYATGQRPSVTMQLNTHFVAAAHPGEFLEARGEVVRLAKSVIFLRGQLTVGDRLVAAADGIWKVLAARPGPRREGDPA